MNLLQNKKVLISLLKQGDVLNDINGGRAQTNVKINKGEQGFTIKIKTPTVRPEHYSIFLDHQRLSISTHAHHPFVEEAQFITMFNRSFKIPSYVDSDGIRAYFQNQSLMVELPFRVMSKEQKRRIRIEHL